VYPNLVAQEICSVQPMQGPSSLVFYLDFITSLAKGGSPTATAGSVYFDARSGPVNDEFYPSGTVPSETMTWTNLGSGAARTNNVVFFPVRPGSISGTATDEASASQTFYDDGNGILIVSSAASITAGASINYATGQISMTPTTGSTEPATWVLSYDYDTEASTQIPGIDLQLTASTLVAEVRKLKANWSMEAAQNLEKIHGINAEGELIGVLAEVIKATIDRRIINDIYAFAGAGNVQWDRTAPVGVPYAEHRVLTLMAA
jgi:hypothetical protein